MIIANENINPNFIFNGLIWPRVLPDCSSILSRSASQTLPKFYLSESQQGKLKAYLEA